MINTSVNKQIVEQLQALKSASEDKALDDYFDNKQKDILAIKYDAQGNVVRDMRKEYDLYNEMDSLRFLPNVDSDYFKSYETYEHFRSTAPFKPDVNKVPLAPIPQYKFKPTRPSLFQTVIGLFM